MTNQLSDTLDVKKWNRRILNNFWIVLFITILVTSINIFSTAMEKSDFFVQYIIYPTISFLLLLLLTELVTFKVNPKLNSYLILFCGGIITFIIIHFHHTVRGIESILLLPMMASCIFFSKRKIIFATAVSVFLYLTLLIFNPIILQGNQIAQVISMIAILVFAGLIATNVMTRGIEILHHLEKSIKSSQELMISKVMIEKTAKTDALTNVNNHRAFQEFTDHLLNHSSGTALHLAIIDLDNFKDVNDTFGHQIGDLILKYAAQVIRETSSEHDFVARYGGEEFVVIFTEMTAESSLEAAERIRQQIGRTKHQELDNQSITVSIGLHSYTANMTKDEWFAGADQALYKAKKSGKNKVITYQEILRH